MAGQITHMEIAYRLAERLGIDEGIEEFILGSVAPDSVHFADNYLEKKIHSHIFENCGPWGDTQDYEQWLKNIKNFWEKYGTVEKDDKRRLFILGICAHCYTDYWNDLLIWRALQAKNVPPMDNEDFKKVYAPETMLIDRWLYQQLDRGPEILELLGNSKEEDFGDFVRAIDMKNMREHLINTQYNLPDPIDVSGHRFYTSAMMLWFLDETTDRVFKQLKEL